MEVKRSLGKLEDYDRHYLVQVYCTNCHKRDAVYVPNGTLKPCFVECEGCNCLTARTL